MANLSKQQKAVNAIETARNAVYETIRVSDAAFHEITYGIVPEDARAMVDVLSSTAAEKLELALETLSLALSLTEERE